jgi:hypothetical protein
MIKDETNAFKYIPIKSYLSHSYVDFRHLFLTHYSKVNNIARNLAVTVTHCGSRVSDTRLTKV